MNDFEINPTGLYLLSLYLMLRTPPVAYSNTDGVIKVNKKLGYVLLSETRVTGTNQSTIVSEMGHSCVQTSRDREDN